MTYFDEFKYEFKKKPQLKVKPRPKVMPVLIFYL